MINRPRRPGGRFTGAARFRFRGDPALAQPFIPEARTYLGSLFDRLAYGETWSGEHVLRNGRGVVFRLQKHGDAVPLVEIDVTALEGSASAARQKRRKYHGLLFYPTSSTWPDGISEDPVSNFHGGQVLLGERTDVPGVRLPYVRSVHAQDAMLDERATLAPEQWQVANTDWFHPTRPLACQWDGPKDRYANFAVPFAFTHRLGPNLYFRGKTVVTAAQVCDALGYAGSVGSGAKVAGAAVRMIGTTKYRFFIVLHFAGAAPPAGWREGVFSFDATPTDETDTAWERDNVQACGGITDGQGARYGSWFFNASATACVRAVRTTTLQRFDITGTTTFTATFSESTVGETVTTTSGSTVYQGYYIPWTVQELGVGDVCDVVGLYAETLKFDSRVSGAFPNTGWRPYEHPLSSSGAVTTSSGLYAADFAGDTLVQATYSAVTRTPEANGTFSASLTGFTVATWGVNPGTLEINQTFSQDEVTTNVTISLPGLTLLGVTTHRASSTFSGSWAEAVSGDPVPVTMSVVETASEATDGTTYAVDIVDLRHRVYVYTETVRSETVSTTTTSDYVRTSGSLSAPPDTDSRVESTTTTGTEVETRRAWINGATFEEQISSTPLGGTTSSSGRFLASGFDANGIYISGFAFDGYPGVEVMMNLLTHNDALDPSNALPDYDAGESLCTVDLEYTRAGAGAVTSPVSNSSAVAEFFNTDAMLELSGGRQWNLGIARTPRGLQYSLPWVPDGDVWLNGGEDITDSIAGDDRRLYPLGVVCRGLPAQDA